MSRKKDTDQSSKNAPKMRMYKNARKLNKRFEDKLNNRNNPKLTKTNRQLNIGKLRKKIKQLTDKLYYISETDADINPFISDNVKGLSKESFLSQINKDLATPIEEIDFEDFFRNLITFQDWFDSEQIKMANKFLKLKKLLELNLSDLKVFKVGRIEIDIYVVGLGNRKKLIGIKTKAVET